MKVHGQPMRTIWVEPDGTNSICIAPQANGRLSSAHVDAAAAVIEGADVVLWAGVSPADFTAFTVTRETADGDQASSGQRVLSGPLEPTDG